MRSLLLLTGGVALVTMAVGGCGCEERLASRRQGAVVWTARSAAEPEQPRVERPPPRPAIDLTSAAQPSAPPPPAPPQRPEPALEEEYGQKYEEEEEVAAYEELPPYAAMEPELPPREPPEVRPPSFGFAPRPFEMPRGLNGRPGGPLNFPIREVPRFRTTEELGGMPDPNDYVPLD